MGLALALGLARLGVASIVLERNGGLSRHSKAPGIHQRTREIFRYWDVDGPMLEHGRLLETITLLATGRPDTVAAKADFSPLLGEADRPGLLLLEQAVTECILYEQLRRTNLSAVRFETEVEELVQSPDGVTLRCQAGGQKITVRGAFAVGCDGARSFMRQALEIPFAGITYSIRPLLADVRLDPSEPPRAAPRIWNDAGGLTAAIHLPGGLWRIIRMERGDPDEEEDVPEYEVRRHVRNVLGTAACTVEWSSRFRIHRRAAERFVVGRVALAGDAAHIHSPAGGLGMNLGIQDAHNLAWKLHAALLCGDHETLLRSYDIERRAAVGHEVSRYADALTRIFLQSPAWLRRMAFGLLNRALKFPLTRSRMLRRISMIDLGYRDSPILGRDHRANGQRLPNVLLQRSDGSTVRLYDLMEYETTLIGVGNASPIAPEQSGCAVISLNRSEFADRSGRLARLLGSQDGWILVRPDHHIAWLGPHMPDALATLARFHGPSSVRRSPSDSSFSESVASRWTAVN